MCSDAGHELIHPNRLGQEVVGAGAQSLDDAAFVARPCHQDDRQRRRVRTAAEGAHDIDPGHAGHAHVEDDDGDGPSVDDTESTEPVGRLHDLEAGPAEGDRHERTDAVVVVDDEDGRRNRVRSHGHAARRPST